MTRGKGLLANLALSAAAIALFLGALEGAARLWERRHPPRPVAEYIWDWQKVWDGEFYTVNADAVGWPPWEEFNGDGLRDRPHPVEKPPRVRRVVFLGDSVTLGDGLAPDQSYPRRLQARLDGEGRAVEVFNVALWGWSTRQQRIAHREIVRRYRPDQVVLGVCLNDIPELHNNLTRPPRLLAALHERSAAIRVAVGAAGREVKSVEELFAAEASDRVQASFAAFFEELRRLGEEVRAGGARFAVLVFPFRFQLAEDAPPPTVQRRIAAWCAAEGVPCLDLLPRLATLGEAAFHDYDHLSAEGADRVAAEVLAAGVVAPAPSAAETLSEVGYAKDPAGALGHEEPGVRSAAIWTLSREAATAASHVAAFTRALREDEDEEVRAAAARALAAAGTSAEPALPALFDALADTREGVRWAAAQSLWALGAARAENVRRLAPVLASPDPYVRGFAAFTLGEIGPAAAEAVPALVAALEREEAYGRGGAALALAKMGPYAGHAVAALVRALQGPDPRRRWNAARTLGRIGAVAAPAVPALLAALEDRDETVRQHAARALGRVGARDPKVREALERATGDDAAPVAREARAALRRADRR